MNREMIGCPWENSGIDDKTLAADRIVRRAVCQRMEGRQTRGWEPARQRSDKQEVFQNFTLHLEFRLPFMPKARGQECMSRSRWEVQILDSFGRDTGDNECGAIYAQFQPLIQMSYPPRCRGRRMTSSCRPLISTATRKSLMQC